MEPVGVPWFMVQVQTSTTTATRINHYCVHIASTEPVTYATDTVLLPTTPASTLLPTTTATKTYLQPTYDRSDPSVPRILLLRTATVTYNINVVYRQ